MPILVVVSGGKKKIRYKPTKAKDAYIGAPFRVNRKYAEKFSDRWVILSAKHGFLDPDSVILGNYNVTFKDAFTNPIGVSQLKNQIKQKGLDVFDTVVVLGGRHYAKAVSEAFSGLGVTIKRPLAGVPLGYALRKVRDAIDKNKPSDC